MHLMPKQIVILKSDALKVKCSYMYAFIELKGHITNFTSLKFYRTIELTILYLCCKTYKGARYGTISRPEKPLYNSYDNSKIYVSVL